MRFIRSMYNLATIALVTLISATPAWAGLPVPVLVTAPTLGGWVLMLLTVLLAVVAYRTLRERAGRRR